MENPARLMTTILRKGKYRDIVIVLIKNPNLYNLTKFIFKIKAEAE